MELPVPQLVACLIMRRLNLTRSEIHAEAMQPGAPCSARCSPLESPKVLGSAAAQVDIY